MPTMTKTKDAIAFLKADHKKVKELFDSFEKAKDNGKKEQLAQQAMDELKIHAALEEEIFYPAAREVLEEQDIADEAEEEHRVAKTIIEELDGKGIEDVEHYEAKFIVLAENVRHHIKEEEGEYFPEVKESDLDLDELGERLDQRKRELMANPTMIEEAVEDSALKPYQKLH